MCACFSNQSFNESQRLGGEEAMHRHIFDTIRNKGKAEDETTET